MCSKDLTFGDDVAVKESLYDLAKTFSFFLSSLSALASSSFLVFSLESAVFLANEINAEAINDFQKINLESDIYILSISDDAIAAVAEKLAAMLPKNAIIAHTSGATSSKVFQPFFENYGVFYPLQTFSKNHLPK